MFSRAIGNTYNNFCENAILWRLHVDGGLVRFLVPGVRHDMEEGKKQDAYDFEEDVSG